MSGYPTVGKVRHVTSDVTWQVKTPAGGQRLVVHTHARTHALMHTRIRTHANTRNKQNTRTRSRAHSQSTHTYTCAHNTRARMHARAHTHADCFGTATVRLQAVRCREKFGCPSLP